MSITSVEEMYKGLSWRDNVGHEEFYLRHRIKELAAQLKDYRGRHKWIKEAIENHDNNR